MQVEVGEGTVVDGAVEFPVSGSAKQVQPVDAATLLPKVLGLSEAEAHAALEPYGEVEDRPVAGLRHHDPHASSAA